MGQSLLKLAKKDISSRSIFNNRLVVEVCEQFHLHYRNLRITLSLSDFVEFSKGLVVSLDRWGKLGQPEPKKGQHIELCRKKIATDAFNDGVQVNLNHNLYLKNKNKIFSEGADFKDERYIHIKVRDIRLEFSLKDFEEFSNVIIEAKKRLEDSDTCASIPQN